MAPAFGGLRFEPGFTGAVEENDDEGEPEPAEARRKSHEVKEVKEVKEIKEAANVQLREVRGLRSTEKRRRAATLQSWRVLA